MEQEGSEAEDEVEDQVQNVQDYNGQEVALKVMGRASYRQRCLE